PAAALLDGGTGLVEDVGFDAGQGRLRGARLGRSDAGQRADHDGAGLGLPPGVDDGGAVATDDAAVPDPRLGVDRFTDAAEHPERREVAAAGDLLALLHERADGRGRGVQDRDAVLLHDVPPAARLRVIRRALVHHLRGAVGQRAVHDVAVPGDPADVGGAPEHVTFGFEVEDVAVGVGGLQQVTARRVLDALGLSGRAG